MDELTYLCQAQGFFTRSQAYDAGCDDRTITWSVRSRLWHRIRHGYYVFTPAWNTLDEVGRHLLKCRCVLHSLGDAVALSHVSGALANGLQVWNVPLDVVDVTRLDGGSGRIEAGVRHHEGLCFEEDVDIVQGMRVLRPTRCALETSMMTSPEGALVVLDSLLHGGHCTPDELMTAYLAIQTWPRSQHVRIPVLMADGGADGAGESRGRWLFRVGGIPVPLLQFQIRDVNGVLVATCDWGWPDLNRYGEFDGKIKYGRLLKPGQQPGDVVFAEKLREDKIREVTGGTMFRLTWDDYDRPRNTLERIQRTLRIAS